MSKKVHVLMALALVAAAGGGRAAQADDYVVGAIGSLTGPFAGFDKAVVDGGTAAITDWNNAGGYKGAHVVIHTLDDESTAATAVTVYRKLTDDPAVRAVFGASASQSLVAMKAISDELKTATDGTATLDTLGVPPAKYFFRALPSTDSYIKTLMTWVKGHGYKTMAALNPSNVTGQAEAALIKKYADSLGIQMVAMERYQDTDTDFTAQLVNIRNANPDFFYAGAIGGPTVAIFKQIKQLKLAMPVAIHSSAFNAAFYQGIGGIAEAEGILTPIERGGLGATATGEAGAEFKRLSDILGHPATNLNTAGWDTVMALRNAVEHSDGSRDGVRDALEATKDLPVIGGYISYSATDHSGKDERAVAVAKMVNGQLIAQ